MDDSTPASVEPSALTIAANAVGDQPTAEDTLGFGPYVECVTAFLTSDETQPPLTISIEGEWGSGKSSFMLQLEKAIRRPSRTDVFMQKLPQSMGGMSEHGSLLDALRSARKQRQRITIRFNAWRHDKQDALWAAFALMFTTSLRKQVGPLRRLKGDISLFFSRLKGLRGWTKLVLSLSCLVIGAVGLYRFVNAHPPSEIRQAISNFTADPDASSKPTDKKSESKQLGAAYEFLLSLGKLGASLALAFLGFLKLRQLKIPLSINLEKYLSKPDYEGHTDFIESFHEDFARLVDAYAKDQRVFVFIDDLDRADVPRAAELMQAINLMIGDAGKLVFILGMDREKVAAGIAQKYKDLLPFIPGLASTDSGPSSQSSALYFGYSYLEKFIQLSFTLPVMSDPELVMSFLSSISRNAVNPSWFDRLKNFWRFNQESAVPARTQIGPLEGAATSTGADAIALEERVEYLRVKVKNDSVQILTIASMVSAIFENNPRRLKQFINTFRLSLFLASSQGLLDKKGNGSPVTPEQLGKFVAIMLRFPDLRSTLSRNFGFLATLERTVNRTREATQFDKWLGQPGVSQVLLYGVTKLLQKEFNPEKYSLEQFPVWKMMSILPKVPEQPNRTGPESPLKMPNETPEAVSDSSTFDNSAFQASAFQDSAFQTSDKTVISDVQQLKQQNAVREVPTEPDDAAIQIESRLMRLDPKERQVFEEALRLLLHEGSVSDHYALRYLLERGLATNWVGVFSRLQRTTNLVQLVPGQPEKMRLEEKEWQIKADLKGAVAAYFRSKQPA